MGAPSSSNGKHSLVSWVSWEIFDHNNPSEKYTMKERKIIITIDPKHPEELKTEVAGFDDNTCLKATKSLEEALGKVASRDLKPEGRKEPNLYEKLGQK